MNVTHIMRCRSEPCSTALFPRFIELSCDISGKQTLGWRARAEASACDICTRATCLQLIWMWNDSMLLMKDIYVRIDVDNQNMFRTTCLQLMWMLIDSMLLMKYLFVSLDVELNYELHRFYKHVKFVNNLHSIDQASDVIFITLCSHVLQFHMWQIASNNSITRILKSGYMFYINRNVIRYEMERYFFFSLWVWQNRDQQAHV